MDHKAINQKLIDDFLRNGGKITKVPSQHFKRADYEAPVLKTRRMLSDLKERAAKTAAEG